MPFDQVKYCIMTRSELETSPEGTSSFPRLSNFLEVRCTLKIADAERAIRPSMKSIAVHLLGSQNDGRVYLHVFVRSRWSQKKKKNLSVQQT